MKYAVLLLIACCAVQIAQAQRIRFTDTGNHWEMITVADFQGGSPAIAKYLSDTAIGGQNYHRLYTNGMPGSADLIAVREDTANGKIYFRFVTRNYTFLPTGDTAEHVLFDYNLRPGDTLRIAWGTYSFLHIVEGFDSVRIGPQYYKHWRIRVEPPGAYEFIEGIGTNQTPVNIINSGFLVDRHYQMRCFSNNGISPACTPAMHVPLGDHISYTPGEIATVDSFDNRLSCTFSSVTAVAALNRNAAPAVTPNPGGKTLRLYIPNALQGGMLMISDVSGRCVCRAEIHPGNTSIGQFLSVSGVYYYTLQDAVTGQRYTGRFVFQQ